METVFPPLKHGVPTTTDCQGRAIHCISFGCHKNHSGRRYNQGPYFVAEETEAGEVKTTDRGRQAVSRIWYGMWCMWGSEAHALSAETKMCRMLSLTKFNVLILCRGSDIIGEIRSRRTVSLLIYKKNGLIAVTWGMGSSSPYPQQGVFSRDSHSFGVRFKLSSFAFHSPILILCWTSSNTSWR